MKRISRLIAALLTWTTLGIHCSSSDAEDTGSQIADLEDYAGYYELDGTHPVIISIRPWPGGDPILLYTDLKTDAIRALSPSGKDKFKFGRELIVPDPAAGHVQFLRSKAGTISGLTLSELGRPQTSGNRVQIDTGPVEFERDGVSFKGTLFLPPEKKEGGSPAILFAHGSGDEGQRHHFDALPWIVARRGFVALAYDKRGTGESTGNWDVGLEVLARDAVRAIEVLRSEKRVDSNRLGILGTSEGGWLAPLTARLDGEVDFLVVLSGGGLTKGDTFLHKHQRRFKEQGLTGDAFEKAMAKRRALVATSKSRAEAGTGNGFDLRISYDPKADWMRFDGSVLALMGESDVLQDTPACARWLRETLAASKSRDWEVKVFPKTHHGMFLAREGGTPEFQTLRVSQKVPGYWPTLIQWLEDHRN